MRVEWDPAIAEENLRKHGVDFADAVGVLEDEYALYQEDSSARGERRYRRLGMDFLGRILLVVYTYRADHIRLISARKAAKRERVTYEQRQPGC